MASLFQKKETGVWYIAYMSGKTRKYKSLRTKDKSLAKRKYHLLETKLDQQKHGLAPKKLRLDATIADYLEAKATTLKPRTLEQYKIQAATVQRLLTVEFVHQITAEILNNYAATRQVEGIANKTIKEELCTLKAALTMAYKNGLLAELPVRSWPSLKIAAVAPDTLGFYSLAEIELLKQHFKGRSFEPVFLFALYTGARRGEIEALTPASVNLAEKTIKIRNAKTETRPENQFRFVPIHPGLMPILSALVKKTKTGQPLFPILVSNNHNYPSKVMQRACAAIGIPYKRFHGLRHVAATYLLAAGVPLRDVMQLMGWTLLSTAQKYIHMANDAAEQMAKLPY
jgi:integrase